MCPLSPLNPLYTNSPVPVEEKRLHSQAHEALSPTSSSQTSLPSTLVQYKDHAGFRKIASTYLLSAKEQETIKRRKASSVRRREEESKASIKEGFEVSLLTAHMKQKNASTTASLISLMCKATEVNEGSERSELPTAVLYDKANAPTLRFARRSRSQYLTTLPPFRGTGQCSRI